MLVHELLLRSARQFPHRPALVARDQRWSYEQLAARVRRRAEEFLERGLQPGDRVAIDVGNTPEAVVCVWATLLAGGAFVCLDPSAPPERFASLLADFHPHLLITRIARLDSLSDGASLPEPQVFVLDENESEARALAAAAAIVSSSPTLDTSALANLIYTSGSTGDAKGVMMTHGSTGAALAGILGYLGTQPEDRTICLLPLSFDYGLYQALMCGATGACLVLEEGFGYPGAVLARLRDEGITTLPGVPTLWALLLRMRGFNAHELPALRTLTNTGAALPVAHVRELRRRFPDARLFLMYGLTECKRVSYLPPDQVDTHPSSVGIAMPDCETAIVDAKGRALPAGEIGELVVRGSNLMAGYWGRADATAARLRPGPWGSESCLYTGDLFTSDGDGYLYFVGRTDDVMKSRGEKVAPIEIEQVLHGMPGVAEAAVVGVDDPVLGQAIRAVVVADGTKTLSPAAVREHCARHLESFKLPHEVILCDELPRNPRGKIDREALRLATPTGGAPPLQRKS